MIKVEKKMNTETKNSASKLRKTLRKQGELQEEIKDEGIRVLVDKYEQSIKDDLKNAITENKDKDAALKKEKEEKARQIEAKKKEKEEQIKKQKDAKQQEKDALKKAKDEATKKAKEEKQQEKMAKQIAKEEKQRAKIAKQNETRKKKENKANNATRKN